MNKLVSALDDFDLGAAKETVKALFSYDCNEELSGKMEELDKLITNLDYDEAKELAQQILAGL